MRINMKTLTRVTWALEVEPSDTIEDIKQKFYATGYYPKNRQCLFFDGKQLEDWQLLSECNIGDNATVHFDMLPPTHVANNVGDKMEFATFLRALGLRHETLQTLISNKITVENFKRLTEPDIKEMFPLIGERLDVRQAVRKANEQAAARFSSRSDSSDDTSSGGSDTESTVSIIVKWRDGKDFVSELVIDSSASVRDLKEKLFHDIPVDQQRLIFARTQLDDWLTLSDYNIQNDDVLEVVLRLRGC